MCMIMPGVEVGENSLVGAGSLVAQDVPAGMVVVGSPARVVKAVADLTCPPGLDLRAAGCLAPVSGRVTACCGW